MQRLTITVWKITFLCICVRVKKIFIRCKYLVFKKENVKIWQDNRPPHDLHYFVPWGLKGEWRGLLIRHGSVLETVSYYVDTRILMRESCVIQTVVLVNSGNRRVYCSRRSRFRTPINTTLLTSSRLHSHLHPPLARPRSASLPTRRRGVTAPRGRSLD